MRIAPHTLMHPDPFDVRITSRLQMLQAINVQIRVKSGVFFRFRICYGRVL